MRTVKYAPEAWKLLNGVFCVYKPAGLNVYQIRKTIIANLVRDLNEMNVRPPSEYVKIEGSISSGKPLTVTSVTNFADHPLVVGPRHQCQDVRVGWVAHLGKYTSGLLVMAVNDSCFKAMAYRNARLIRTYEIKGKFGIATDNFMEDGKVIEKTTYGHLTQVKLDRILASVQSQYQIEAYKYAKVSVHSEAAYELASKGLIRPAGKSPTLIYGIRCIEFDLPNFTLELHCINENEMYLRQLVHDIGLNMKSCAVCSQIQQTQYGLFTLKHALLRKHWNLECILNNIHLCKELGEPTKVIPTSAQLMPISSESSNAEV